MLKASRHALSDFDDAARRWGWQSDQGYIASEVKNAEEDYVLCKDALVKRIEFLEAERKKWRQKAQRYLSTIKRRW